MPNYFLYTYLTASVLAIIMALIGLSPGIIQYESVDKSLFIGLLGYAYFLSISLMLTLLIPAFRKEILERVGKKVIFAQCLLTVPFIMWGTLMLMLILNQPA